MNKAQRDIRRIDVCGRAGRVSRAHPTVSPASAPQRWKPLTAFSPGGDSHGASEGGRHCECRECNASLVSNAVTVMRIATGEIEEATAEDGKNKAAMELGRKGGTAKATE